MKNKSFDFVKNLPLSLIVYGIVFVLGIVFIFVNGLNLDIDFKGGTRFEYSFAGEINTEDVQKTVEDILNKKATVLESSALSGDSKKLVISLVADESVSAELQQKLTDSLIKEYPDNTIAFYGSNSVSGSVASNFFLKALAAVIIVAVLVLVFVSFRFKKIGGFTAGLTALIALILDVCVAFFACAIFKLEIDLNFMAVVLTILGYSLNDTIVIYDRIRENSAKNQKLPKSEIVNMSLSQVLRRTITTSVTTVIAVLVILVVAEFFGLSSLRSFAVPMMFGLISGSCSSIFVSAPLWVKWQGKVKPKKR